MALNKACIFIVLIALLPSLVSAATSCSLRSPVTTTITIPGAVYNEAIAVSLIALTLSIDVVAIGYIISRIFSGAGLKGWIEREYYEIAKTMILIASIFSILLFMSSMAVIISGQTPSSSYSSNLAGLVNSGEIYLTGVDNNIACAYDAIGGLSIGIGALTSLTIQYYDPTPPVPVITPAGITLPYLITGVAFAPAGLTNEMLTPYSITVRNYESILSDTIVIVLFPISVIIGGEMALLPYIVKVGLLLVIPIGLILRSFPFVRGVGGVLIAIGIGISIIYPSLLVILNAPVTSVLNTAFNGPTTPSSPPCTSGIICLVVNGYTSVLTNMGISTTSIVIGLSALYSIYPTINDLVYHTVNLVVQFVLFILDLAIAIPLMDTIARMLGSSTGVVTSIGSKLRLV
ncbi:hypothetical protein M1394_02185 [Candidatus Marsarchaeota archaeon]|nr:hypothetical protein [Candidatus Marsarchaeota archaeon]